MEYLDQTFQSEYARREHFTKLLSETLKTPLEKLEVPFKQDSLGPFPPASKRADQRTPGLAQALRHIHERSLQGQGCHQAALRDRVRML